MNTGDEFVSELCEAIRNSFQSPNEMDRNGETANVVDGLFFIGRGLMEITQALERIATAMEKKP